MSKSPLNNPKAERGCIGSLLLEPKLLDEMPQELQPEAFYDDVLGLLFRIMQELRAAGTPIDSLTVADEFDKRESVTGGTLELCNELFESVPTTINAYYYAKMIIECWKRRQAATALDDMRNLVRDPAANLDEVLGQIESKIVGLTESCLPRSQIAISDLLADCLDEKVRCAKGAPTGFHQLDSMTTGLHPGQLVIVAARTTIGKSALCANIATNLVERGDGVLIITLEMSKADFIYRLAARLSGLTLKQIRSSNIDCHQPILDAFNAMNHWPLFIDDTVPQTAAQIGAKARILVRKHKIKLVIVDYLQLVRPSDTRAPREQQVAGISRDLKMLAKQIKIPILALSQLNRQSETRATKLPQLSDIRESGAVEQDADGIWLLHRPGFGDSSKDENEAELIVAKNRQGPTGSIKMEWIGSRFLYREREEGSW